MSDYTSRQEQHDQEYRDAWKDAPESFKRQAAKIGISESFVDDDPSLDAREFDDNYPGASITPDMAAMLDTYIDHVIEKHGTEHAKLIKNIFDDFIILMKGEVIKATADLLGKTAGYLIYMQNEKGNNLARIHALLHSMPGYARQAGYPSMRSSAKACHVSPEWLRRKRDQWCVLLGLEPPSDRVKSKEAKAKYRSNALRNHWRMQKFTAKRGQ